MIALLLGSLAFADGSLLCVLFDEHSKPLERQEILFQKGEERVRLKSDETGIVSTSLAQGEWTVQIGEWSQTVLITSAYESELVLQIGASVEVLSLAEMERKTQKKE